MGRIAEAVGWPMGRVPSGPRWLIDVAYGAIAWVALVMLGSVPLFVLDLPKPGIMVLMMLAGVWVSALMAGAFAVLLSLVCWRESPLFIAAAVLACAFSLVMDVVPNSAGPLFLSALIGAWSLLVGLCVRWFAFARPRTAMPRPPVTSPEPLPYQ